MRPAPTTPQWPSAGTHNAKLLGALLDAHPAAVWHPNSRMRLMAHSRAADLRALGWPVVCVKRIDPETGLLQHGYVLRMRRADVARARREAAGLAPDAEQALPIDDDVWLTMQQTAARTSLTVPQLRHLWRAGIVLPDDPQRRSARYAPRTVQLLTAAGVLVQHGVGLDRAIALLRQHSDDLRLAADLATGRVVA